MKPTRAGSSQSCSCTSCFYKTESDKPSGRHKLRHGSRLDRYYADNNIPVREQKLLNKLIRTRAVYDDIRKQLLSDTNITLELKRKRGTKESESDFSSNILNLVNVVDKGEAGQASLSECCSCCSCDSKFQLKGHRTVTHRHRLAIDSGTSVDSGRHFRQATGPRPMYDEPDIPGQRKHRGDHRIGKRVRNKAKLIQSDPCSCILKSIGLLEPLPKKSCSKQVMKRLPLVRDSQTKELGKGYQLKKAYHKIESGMGEAVRKSGSKMIETKRQLGVGVKKSLENLKKVESKIIETVQKAKAKYGGNLEAAKLLELYENTFGVTLPSEEFLHDDEEKQMDKIMKKWFCDFECNPEECVPTECLELKKRSLRLKRKDPKTDKEIQESQIKKAAVKPGTKVPNVALEDKNKKAVLYEQQRINLQGSGKGKSIQINIKGKVKKAGEAHSQKVHHQDQNDVPAQKRTRHKTSNTQSGGYDLKRCFCTLKLKPKSTKPRMNKVHREKTKKPEAKSSQTMNLDTKPPPPHTHNIKRQRSHPAFTETQSRTRRSQSTPSLTSRTLSIGRSEELASYVPRAIENKLVHREPVQKFLKEGSPGQSVVRYGSTFSFNIEFYKGTPPYRELRDTDSRNYFRNKDTIRLQKKAKGDTTKQHDRVIHQPRINLIHKSSQINSSGISKHSLTKHKIRRTLHHAKQGVTKHQDYQVRKSSKSTLASGQSLPTVKANFTAVDKATLKKDNNRFPVKLLPYECEPGVCIPGQCNPYECLKLVNARNNKRRAKSTETANRLTKSSNSIIRRPHSNSKTTETQSILMNSRRPHRKEYNNVTKQPRPPKLSFNTPDRLKHPGIGSSISFNVEFYKLKSVSNNNSSTYRHGERRESSRNKVPQRSTRKRPKDRGSQKILVDMKNQSTVQMVEKKNKGVFMNTALKRCFCMLKIRKFVKNKRSHQVATASTKTAAIDERTFPKLEMVTKGTKTERKLNNKLEPFECEPYYCVPGECDPYQCLERIKLHEKSKSKEFGIKTSKSIMNSMSSATSSITKNVYIQSNFNDLMHTKKPLKYSRNSLSIDNYKSSRPKVAQRTSSPVVRIGSNISFNIEIYKTKFKQNDFERALQQKNTKKDVSLLPSKVLKNHNVSTTKLSLRGRESQSTKGIKSNKSTGIRPKLKRCFCTLKLQNKLKDRNNKNNMYIKPIQATVMPAQMFYNNAKISKYKAKKILEYKNGNSLSVICSSTSHSFKPNKLPLRNDVEGISTSGMKLNRTHLLQINPFIKRSFYAMNLQLDQHRHKRGILERYECEPGVCVPGQCDPIECQKRILKRLMRKASTMTSTGRESRSMSSETANLYPDLRSKQQQYGHNIQKTPHEIHNQTRTHDTSLKLQEETVRVGSRVSFNVEFYKNNNDGQIRRKSSTTANDNHYGRSDSVASSTSTRKHFKTTGTRGYRGGHRDRDSQSIIRRHHRGSNPISPNNKRCFCTLKLQKRGKQQTAGDFTILPATSTIGQNTDKFKPNYINNLKSYECEPYVCVPGECNPHECLERIKRRNKRLHNKGFGTADSRYSYASTMTPNMNIPARGKYVQFNENSPQIYGTDTNITKPGSTERNVVRVGSNISFKLEFYKDNGQKSAQLPQKIYNDQTRSDMYTQDNGYNKKTEPKSVDMNVMRQNRESQVDSILKKHRACGVGTMLKRCFCTLALHKQTPQESRPRYNEPKMVTYGTQSPNFRNTPDLKDASQNYRRGYKLDPYECEPGVCTPGQCDPYECAKLIKKRQLHEFGTSTPKHRGRSTSTGTRNYKKYTDRDVQSTKKYTTGNTGPRGRHESSNSQRQLDHDKQGVRFGSNISFNLEFYKCNNEGCDFIGHGNNQEMLQYKSKRDSGVTRRPMRFIDHPSQAQGMYINRPSQFDRLRMDSKGTGVGPFLNRCFCTLKLQKLGKHQHHKNTKKTTRNNSMVTQGDYKEYDPILYKERGTKPRQMDLHLEPYECKPGTCVPGYCNPEECYKRIQRRNLRTVGTGTKHYPGRHVSNSTYDREMRNTQTPRDRTVLERSIKNDFGQSQRMEDLRAPVTSSVTRIGSSVSFNVEFYKQSPGNFTDNPRHGNFESVETASVTGDRPKVRSRNQYSNYTGPVTYHNQQQAQANSADKDSDMGPMLKRCFCTLALQTNDFEKQLPNISTQDKSTGVHHKFKKLKHTLEPYECEPGVCVPGQCDPYQCLNRIKRRGRRTSRVGTRSYYSRSRSTATGFDLQLTPKTRSRLIQSHGPMAGPPRRMGGGDPRLAPDSGKDPGKRIGSNISLKIEFFKENVPPAEISVYRERENSNHNYNEINNGSVKGQLAKLTNTNQLMRDSAIMAKQKTSSRTSAAGKALKRCFCTATLYSAEKLLRKKQVVTVGRVDKMLAMTPFKLTQNCVPCQAGTKTRTTGFNVNKKYMERNNIQQTSTIPKNVKKGIDNNVEFTNNEICKCLRCLSFLTKKIGSEDNDPPAYTTVQISGDDMTKDVSVLYDQDPRKETTVVMIGGSDVEYKVNQGTKNTTRCNKQNITNKRLESYAHTKQKSIDESNKHQILNNNVVNNIPHMTGFQIKILAQNKSFMNKFGSQGAGGNITSDVVSNKNMSTLGGRDLTNIHNKNNIEHVKENKRTGHQTKQHKTITTELNETNLKTDVGSHNYTQPHYDRSHSYCAQICDKKYRKVKDSVKGLRNKKVTANQIKKKKTSGPVHNTNIGSKNYAKLQTNIDSKSNNKQQSNIDSKNNDIHQKLDKKHTMIEISGDELTKNISEVYERQKKTTVVMIGGADIDCKVGHDDDGTTKHIKQNKPKKETDANANTKWTDTFQSNQSNELYGQWYRFIEKFKPLNTMLNYIKHLKSKVSGNVPVKKYNQNEPKLQSKKTQKSMLDRTLMPKVEKFKEKEASENAFKKIKAGHPSCKHNEVYVKTNVCSLNYTKLQSIKNNDDIKNAFQNNAYRKLKSKPIMSGDVLDSKFQEKEPSKRSTKTKAVGSRHNEVCLNNFKMNTKSQQIKNKIKNVDVADTAVQKVKLPEHRTRVFDNWTKKHKYTKVEITGDELIQNISDVYDPDLEMESTVVMVGGADVDCKISQCVKDTTKKKPEPPYTEIEISGGDLTQNISAQYNRDLAKETAIVVVGGADFDYKISEKNKKITKPRKKNILQAQNTHATDTQNTYTKLKSRPTQLMSGDMPYDITENKLIKYIGKKIKSVHPKPHDVYLRQNEVYVKSNICSQNYAKLKSMKDKNKEDNINNAVHDKGHQKQNQNLMSGDMPDNSFKETSKRSGKKITAVHNHNKICSNICLQNYTNSQMINKNKLKNNDVNKNVVREKMQNNMAKKCEPCVLNRTKKGILKRQDTGKYSRVQISGNELTQNISEVYDPNLAKITTTVVVGSADVDYKFGKSIKPKTPGKHQTSNKMKNCIIPDKKINLYDRKIVPPCNCREINNKANTTLPNPKNKMKICELCPNPEKQFKQSFAKRILTAFLQSSSKQKHQKLTETCKNRMVMIASPKLKLNTVVVNQKDPSKKKNHRDSKQDNPLTVVTISGADVSHVTRNDKPKIKTEIGKGPCVCGSPICKKPKKTKNAKIKVKPCVCGNKVCKRTVAAVASLKDIKSKVYPELTKKQRKRKKKLKKIQDVLYKKGLNRRLKTYQKEDQTRFKERMQKDLEMYKKVKKYRKTSDSVLLAESFIDIMKLGCTAVKDVGRSGYRTVIDPQHSYHSLKTLATNPRRACNLCKRSVRQSGVGSTLQRIKMRIIAMKRFKLCKKKLESNSFTNYMVHMGDDDPKKRMKKIKKKKKIRKREPMDFQCSIYMASLRKRPFLSVYYACPWFYPHCLSLLNVWRQLSDIALFLLAVAVWSPCILMMEACRALLCCTVCTG